jgi:hypothetical protein
MKTDAYKISFKKYITSELGKNNILNNRIKRREFKNNCTHSFSIKEWKQKCKSCDGFCPYCNKAFDNYLHKLTMDHIISLSKASEIFKLTGKRFVYTIDDVQPMCLSCNCSKQDKIINPKHLNTLKSLNII